MEKVELANRAKRPFSTEYYVTSLCKHKLYSNVQFHYYVHLTWFSSIRLIFVNFEVLMLFYLDQVSTTW